MKHWGLFWKLFLAFAASIALTAVLFGAFAVPDLVEQQEQELERELRSALTVVREWARPHLERGEDEAELAARVGALGAKQPVRLTVVDASGRVVADTHRDPAGMEDHSQRPELIQARDQGRGRALRPSSTLDIPMLYVAQALVSDGELKGYVRASKSLGVIDARRRQLIRIIVGAALGAMLAGFVVSFFMSRRLIRPIRGIAEAVEAISEGDYGRKVPVASRDEIGRLADTFNQMASELKDRVETISRDRTELLAMLSAMTEGVLAVDRDERIVLMNDAAGRLLGMEPGEATGRRVWEVTRISEVGDVLTAAIDGGHKAEVEVQLTGVPRDRHLQLLGAPVRVPGGEVQGAVVVLHDISEVRRLEKVRQDFVANVSHELKTPLSAIRGFAETILEDPAMDPETRAHFLERVRRQAVRLTDLVEEVLALSRLQSDRDAVALDAVDVVASVREAVHSLQPLAREREIELVEDLPGAEMVIRGEDEAIRRVAGNLLDNALKYTPQGGRVAVRLKGMGDVVRLEVEDTGIGIPLEARERVFERFYRVDPGRSRAAGGTGLGLSIVKHLVQAMGGRVWVDEAEGGGSVFRVELPGFRPGRRTLERR